MHKRPLVLCLLPLWLALLLLGAPPASACDNPLDLELVGAGLGAARALYLSDPEQSGRALVMLRDLERRLTCTLEPVSPMLLARMRYLVAFLAWSEGDEAQARAQLAQAYGVNPELESDTGLGEGQQQRAFQALAEQVRIEQVYGVIPAQVLSQVRSGEPPVIVNGQGLPAGLPRKVAPGKLLIQQRTAEGLYKGQWILVSSGSERILTGIESGGASARRAPSISMLQVSLGSQRLQPMSRDRGLRNYVDVSPGLQGNLTLPWGADRKLSLLLSVSPGAITLQDWSCASAVEDCEERRLASKMSESGPFLSLWTEGVQLRQGRALSKGGLLWYGPELRLVEQTWGMVLVRAEPWLEGSWLGALGGLGMEVAWPLPPGMRLARKLTLGVHFNAGLGGMWQTRPAWKWHGSGAYLGGIWLGLGDFRWEGEVR